MAVRLKSIQTGTLVLAAANASNTASITTVDTTKSIIFYTQQCDTSCVRHENATCEIYFSSLSGDDSAEITATRDSTLGAVTIRYWVWDFYEGVTVQHIRDTIARTAGTSPTTTITSVTTGETFLISAERSTSHNDLGSGFCNVLTDATTVTHNVGVFDAQYNTVQVISWDGATVQAEYDATNTGSRTFTTTSVTLADSLFLGSRVLSSGTADGYNDMQAIDAVTTTSVVWNKGSGGNTDNGLLYNQVVEITDFNNDQGSSQITGLTDDNTISTTGTYTMPYMGFANGSYGSVDSEGVTNPDKSWLDMTNTSTTNLRATRTDDGQNMDYLYQQVNYTGLVGPAGTINAVHSINDRMMSTLHGGLTVR